MVDAANHGHATAASARPDLGAVGRPLPVQPSLHIDCHACTARPAACGDCVVSFLLGGPLDDGEGLDPTEVAALAVLADSGLVPPLRLVTEHGP